MADERGESSQNQSDPSVGADILDTGAAPSLPGDINWPKRQSWLVTLADGTSIGDFEIIRRLGHGAAGDVYLARQRSLDRQVALKITPNVGNEARAMATLEHPHIVQVFSEEIDPTGDARLICMQYVPGATLADVLSRLKVLPREQLSGAALLAAIDALGSGRLQLDADALRDRQQLSAMGYVEAVCWITARLAEALHFAHRRGVLHRDIKPANILIDPYGHPLLADFSLSLAAPGKGAPHDQVFGGTLAYMAPEHLDAFIADRATTSQSVDERSDVYSLGIVLYELLTLERPFATPSSGGPSRETLTRMAQDRRSPPPALHERIPDVPICVEHAVGRCLAADPAQRYQDAGLLAQALDGCRRLCQANRELPKLGPFMTAIARAPLTATVVAAFAPHLIGSLFASAYNGFIVFPRLSPEQQARFVWTALINCAIAFPAVAVAVVLLYTKTIRTWSRLCERRSVSAAEVDRARRRLNTTPVAAVGFSLFGWLPPLVVIPLSLRQIGGEMSWEELTHLAISLLLSFLLAATYSFFIAQYAMVRLLYPRAWVDAQRFAYAPREELAVTLRWLRWFQGAAGIVPLAGAMLIVAAGPETFAPGTYFAFRWLALCLILLGMAGIWLALDVGGLIVKSIEALTRAGRNSDAAAH